MIRDLTSHTRIDEIVGDMARLRARGAALGELAMVENPDGSGSLARVVELSGDRVTLEVYAGGKGLSTAARVRFLGQQPGVACSSNILGRIFRGSGEPIDGGPSLSAEQRIPLNGPPANPVVRLQPSRMIETRVPMIDVFNCLVESQKIPIFSVAGEPYNALLARIGFQANADVVVFGGMGLVFDDYHFFRNAFVENGVAHRTVMYVNQASDPLVERLLVPDLALAVAERFAAEEGKRVLVLLTDMTAYADAMRETGVAQERIPAVRGYMGDLYTQLAQRYEKACAFPGAGSVTILAVTTMPGDDVTHPVPDNTGYITEGQLYLHGGRIDPFGSLSRLKQHVVGKATREDHSPLASAMIRLYAEGAEAERKRAMAFELSSFDERALRFARLFRERFMDIRANLPVIEALDLGWSTLAECFEPGELLVRQDILDKFYPRDRGDRGDHVQAPTQ
jgi:V/A-type H+-transporting ATPase subunit B